MISRAGRSEFELCCTHDRVGAICTHNAARAQYVAVIECDVSELGVARIRFQVDDLVRPEDGDSALTYDLPDDFLGDVLRDGDHKRVLGVLPEGAKGYGLEDMPFCPEDRRTQLSARLEDGLGTVDFL